MSEEEIINHAISLGWTNCKFFTVRAHRACDGSWCPEIRLSQGKFPPNFHWSALPIPEANHLVSDLASVLI